MKLLIFDMDGVLIKSGGYHQALKDTVRVIGDEIGIKEAILTDEQIAKFEALGISSEWHSSAFCKAIMLLQQNKEMQAQINRKELSDQLDLEDLFEAIASQPMQVAPLDRGKTAIKSIAKKYGIAADRALKVLNDSHTVDTSKAVSTFEELVLGSGRFRVVYDKEPQFSNESYLLEYDQKLIKDTTVNSILDWNNKPGYGAAIMTNRPSKGPNDFRKSPDAELGLQMIGLESLPAIGFGEISWLANQSGKRTEEIGKPSVPHALAAILTASGWPVKKSLEYSIQDLNEEELAHLNGSEITVFEDTPAGIVAVQKAVDFLNNTGLNIRVNKYGVAKDAAKESALTAQGAQVFPDINRALANLIA